jgi:DNA-binding response OmpR family regulator
MLAHSDQELCLMMQDILVRAGMSAMIAHDGDAVLAMMESNPPQVAVVDVALQGLYVFEVVEKVRQRPGLENVKVLLLSSVYSKTAYKRSPSSLYNADDYIEKHHIPVDLVPKINHLIVDAAPAGNRTLRGEEERAGQVLTGVDCKGQLDFIKSVNEKIQTAEDLQVEGRADGSDIERAHRLARIIVSDVALYCQEKVDEGIRGGNWVELLSAEVREARRLFRERFPDQDIQNAKILEKAFLDLLQHRQQELDL